MNDLEIICELEVKKKLQRLTDAEELALALAYERLDQATTPKKAA